MRKMFRDEELEIGYEGLVITKKHVLFGLSLSWDTLIPESYTDILIRDKTSGNLSRMSIMNFITGGAKE